MKFMKPIKAYVYAHRPLFNVLSVCIRTAKNEVMFILYSISEYVSSDVSKNMDAVFTTNKLV
jgi:hypothetical protein